MKFTALPIAQGRHSFYMFKCKASELWSFSEIDQRQEDKEKGYQRVLSPSRVRQIKNFIVAGNAIPGAIILSIDKAVFAKGKIEFTEKPDAAWIVDGQHRSAGAHEAARAGTDIELPIIAFIGLKSNEQANYFVTINKEARGVPSSLYIDLLKDLPRQKSEKERLEERIADIARMLNRNEDGPVFQRIVSTTKPKEGQLSLTNVARVLRPIFHPTQGILGPSYKLNEQAKIIENYIAGFEAAFPKVFEKNVIFKTLGFGAIFKAFPLIFSTTISRSSGKFRAEDVAQTLALVGAFDFDGWERLGTGNQAETMAGEDFISEFQSALENSEEESAITLD